MWPAVQHQAFRAIMFSWSDLPRPICCCLWRHKLMRFTASDRAPLPGRAFLLRVRSSRSRHVKAQQGAHSYSHFVSTDIFRNGVFNFIIDPNSRGASTLERFVPPFTLSTLSNPDTCSSDVRQQLPALCLTLNKIPKSREQLHSTDTAKFCLKDRRLEIVLAVADARRWNMCKILF